MQKIHLSKFSIGEGEPLAIMCGPCVIESLEHSLRCAESLLEIFGKTNINFIFKSSYDKANRSSIHSFRGPGIEEGLRILERIKTEFGVPVVTDVHSPQEATLAGEVCEILQIPAFLCRQTDLIIAAAETKRIISVKKGQFMAPWDMKNVIDKCRSVGNPNVILTDRGTTFGYNNLVSDFRAIPIMQAFGVPVCFDATHSVQLPGGRGDSSGGQREFIPLLAKAAIASGANCLFIEAHPDPKHAKSDAASVMDFKDLLPLLTVLEKIYQIINPA